MDEAELPECPVCLQPYGFESAIPRVLSCGHTTCEFCLKNLAKPFPNTLRCVVCTQIVKFQNSPSSLPKNLDLLHYSSSLQRPAPDKKVTSETKPKQSEEQDQLFLSKSWSFEFCRNWRRWVVPKDCISVEVRGDGVVLGKVLRNFESDYAVACVMEESQTVSLVKVGNFAKGRDDSGDFVFGYEARVVSVLHEMRQEERDELGLLLNAGSRIRNVGQVYGFWYCENDDCVYLVIEKFEKYNLRKLMLEKKEVTSKLTEIPGFALMGMEICETLTRLHSEGLAIGCLSASCIGFDGFSNANVDLSEVLKSGRKLSSTVRRKGKALEVNLNNGCSLDEDIIFISPEMLSELIHKEGFELNWGKSRHEVGSASDVWSFSCLLMWIIVGSSFTEVMKSFMHCVVDGVNNEKGFDFIAIYNILLEKIFALIGTLGLECDYLLDVLGRCLALEPEDRPRVSELWKCFRKLIVGTQIYTVLGLKPEVNTKGSFHCISLGELCQMSKENDKELIKDFKQKDDDEDKAHVDIVEGVSNDQFKCIDMKGHFDCITGLAIGGDFLFSSSYDKIVNVWSLQDFTHIHSFKTHQYRVMAVAYADIEQPLCISGDSEGVICLWKANFPFSDSPIKTLHEQKDWRYSGIHAVAVSGNEYLYTGSGDKLVKAWSLKDYTLSCTMEGHRSVVSSLLVCNGVLYSGSWDGTVRLWSLSDHSSLAVLGEDKIGNSSSVLSLTTDRNLLFVGHENGTVKIWQNDAPLKSVSIHKGAIFSVSKNGKWLFSGGWDKTVNLQEICDSSDQMDLIVPMGSISCNSTVTALTYWQGKLFVGQADRTIKVYRGVAAA